MTLKTATLPLVLPGAEDCAPCAERVRAALSAARGINQVAVDEARSRLQVTYDADLMPLARVQTLIEEAGASVQHQIGHASFALSGLDCADCAMTIERGVSRLPGVLHASASFAGSRMNVEYEAGKVAHEQIVRRVRELGYDVAAPARGAAAAAGPLVFDIGGMDCTDCAKTIESQVARLPGVGAASVNFMAAKLTVDAAQPGAVSAGTIERAVADAGYSATLAVPVRQPAAPEPLLRRYAKLWPTAAAALLWAVAFVLEQFALPRLLTDAVYGAAIAVGGWRIALSGFWALVRGRTLGIDALMTIAVVGAALIGEWSEGAAVVVLFSLGEALEGLTVDKARNAIRSLMELAPAEATVKTASGERQVAVEAIVPGDTVVIRPGERVAVDGRVSAGSTTINQASITGESLPVLKEVGDVVYAGTLNERGAVEVEVTRRAQDSTLAHIIDLVEEAQASRAPSQRFVEGFARYYTPAVMIAAILVAAVPPLLGQPFLPWLYKALVLLVIACPCALVISTPVSIVAAIARGSRSGVLIKGGAHLEALGTVRTVAFDKTGTLTEGRPAITDLIPLHGGSADEVLALAAAVESKSEHPLAGAILRGAAERQLQWSEPQSFEALTGMGARALVDGQLVTVGKPEILPAGAELQARIAALQQDGKTVLVVGRAGTPLGLIAVADQLRPGVAAAVAGLRRAGITSVVMLSGDNERVAQAVAGRVGIEQAYGNLLPEQKTERIKALLAERGPVAMVGDGVNDAPALASATVGVAMGAAGSDTALETADIALMADDLSKLPYVIGLSRAALATIRVNIGFALLVKAIFLALTLFGVANLWLAILADTGAALLVIANGMRLLRFRDRPTEGTGAR